MEFDSWSDERLLTTRRMPDAGRCFATFYRRHERPVAAFHVRRVGNAELATDLTAETFAQALASRHRFRARGTGSGARWLYGIAHNVLAHSARTAARDRSKVNELGIHVARPDEQQRSELEALREERAVLQALSHLPADQQEAVRGYVLDGIPYADLANEAATSEAAMRQRVSRGLAVLRKQTEELR